MRTDTCHHAFKLYCEFNGLSFSNKEAFNNWMLFYKEFYINNKYEELICNKEDTGHKLWQSDYQFGNFTNKLIKLINNN